MWRFNSGIQGRTRSRMGEGGGSLQIRQSDPPSPAQKILVTALVFLQLEAQSEQEKKNKTVPHVFYDSAEVIFNY